MDNIIKNILDNDYQQYKINIRHICDTERIHVLQLIIQFLLSKNINDKFSYTLITCLLRSHLTVFKFKEVDEIISKLTTRSVQEVKKLLTIFKKIFNNRARLMMYLKYFKITTGTIGSKFKNIKKNNKKRNSTCAYPNELQCACFVCENSMINEFVGLIIVIVDPIIKAFYDLNFIKQIEVDISNDNCDNENVILNKIHTIVEQFGTTILKSINIKLITYDEYHDMEMIGKINYFKSICNLLEKKMTNIKSTHIELNNLMKWADITSDKYKIVNENAQKIVDDKKTQTSSSMDMVNNKQSTKQKVKQKSSFAQTQQYVMCNKISSISNIFNVDFVNKNVNNCVLKIDF